jgi:hypothetical protein
MGNIGVLEALSAIGGPGAAVAAIFTYRQAKAAETAITEARMQSAVAREAVAEARSQNQIALHRERLATYKALLAFQSQLLGQGVHYKAANLWALWERVQIAEFYFSDRVAKELKGIVDLALEVQSSRSLWDEASEAAGEERKRLVENSIDLLNKLHDRIRAIDPVMRYELKLVSLQDPTSPAGLQQASRECAEGCRAVAQSEVAPGAIKEPGLFGGCSRGHTIGGSVGSKRLV